MSALVELWACPGLSVLAKQELSASFWSNKSDDKNSPVELSVPESLRAQILIEYIKQRSEHVTTRVFDDEHTTLFESWFQQGLDVGFHQPDGVWATLMTSPNQCLFLALCKHQKIPMNPQPWVVDASSTWLHDVVRLGWTDVLDELHRQGQDWNVSHPDKRRLFHVVKKKEVLDRLETYGAPFGPDKQGKWPGDEYNLNALRHEYELGRVVRHLVQKRMSQNQSDVSKGQMSRQERQKWFSLVHQKQWDLLSQAWCGLDVQARQNIVSMRHPQQDYSWAGWF